MCVCVRARADVQGCVCVLPPMRTSGDGHLIVDYQELQLTHRQLGNDSSHLHVYLVSSGGVPSSDEKEVDEKVGPFPSYGAIPKGQNEPFFT